MTRTFISLGLSNEAINEIKRIQDLLMDKNLFSGKFTGLENLHLTLKFLGEISEEKICEVRKILEKIRMKKFFAKFSDIGVFSPEFIRILWIKLDGEGVFDLQEIIDQKLSDLFEPENRFMSHITIARIKNIKDRKKFFEYINSIKVNEINFEINCFYLMSSNLTSKGPIYTVLNKYNLI
ncbi:MAG: RNA 2',3'-cyclic phosphodiesterase [Candidatus Pacearchaeota archaeon]